MSSGWDRVRTIADAVLYEGYLLYPYRANSRKNQTRWQFGVLGPQRAEERGIGEDDTMSAQGLIDSEAASLSVVVRVVVRPLPGGQSRIESNDFAERARWRRHRTGGRRPSGPQPPRA